MSLSPLFTILKSQILHVSKKSSDHCHFLCKYCINQEISQDIRSNSGNAELRCCNGRGDQELDRQNAEDFADKAVSYSNVVYPCQLLAASKCFKLPRSAQFLAFKLIQAVCSDATSAPGAVSRSTDIYSMTRIDETCPAERGQVVSTPSSPPWQVTNLALDILDLL